MKPIPPKMTLSELARFVKVFSRTGRHHSQENDILEERINEGIKAGLLRGINARMLVVILLAFIHHYR